MTRTSQALPEAVRTMAEPVARRCVGLAVGAFAGPEAVVHTTGPVTDDTLFQIGSVTKVVTALALADLVARGELTLDTPLATYLPGAPASRTGAPITLGHLATHTAGLPRLPGGLRPSARRNPSDPYREFGTEDLLRALATTRLRGEPGTRPRYSNFGAGLLGEALARHTGLPYPRVVAEHVTGPLGLPDTVVDPHPDQLRRKAAGHSFRRRPVPDWHMGALPGAGALYSTVPDLVALLRAHVHPEGTARADALRLVQQPRVRVTRRLQMGLGWLLAPSGAARHTALWHNGGTGGYRSFVAVVPAADVGVVALTDTARSVDRLGFRLLARLADLRR